MALEGFWGFGILGFWGLEFGVWGFEVLSPGHLCGLSGGAFGGFGVLGIWGFGV